VAREYLNGGSCSILIQTNSTRSKTPTYQEREKTRELTNAMDYDDQ
jgi:hypothetical protein